MSDMWRRTIARSLVTLHIPPALLCKKIKSEFSLVTPGARRGRRDVRLVATRPARAGDGDGVQAPCTHDRGARVRAVLARVCDFSPPGCCGPTTEIIFPHRMHRSCARCRLQARADAPRRRLLTSRWLPRRRRRRFRPRSRAPQRNLCAACRSTCYRLTQRPTSGRCSLL